MELLARAEMAKGKGKPQKKNVGSEEPEGDDLSLTRQIRVFRDLADMIGEIYDAKGRAETVANIVDTWLRPSVLAEHARLKDAIDVIKRARKKVQKPPPE